MEQALRSRHHLVRSALSVAMLAAAGPGNARAESVVYRGKTIEFLVAGDIGGGYDLAARAIANDMARHIPGHPAPLSCAKCPENQRWPLRK
jgi:tripartite-type tricarboxylate transporter receptor subunit TctC